MSGLLKKALKRGEELLKRGKRAQLSEPLKKVPERNLAKKQEVLLRQEIEVSISGPISGHG